jgi:hypothetical protein
MDLKAWLIDTGQIALIIFGFLGGMKMFFAFLEKRRNSIPIADVVEENKKKIKSNSDKIGHLFAIVEELKGQKETLLMQFNRVEISNREIAASLNQLIVFFMKNIEGGRKELSGFIVQGIGLKNGDNK